MTSYEQSTLHATFAQIRAEYPDVPIRVAVYYATERLWKPYSRKKVDLNVIGSFAIARDAILAFNDPE